MFKYYFFFFHLPFSLTAFPVCLTNKRIKSILWLRHSRVSSSLVSLLTTDEKAKGFVLGSDESIAVNPLSISYLADETGPDLGARNTSTPIYLTGARPRSVKCFRAERMGYPR